MTDNTTLRSALERIAQCGWTGSGDAVGATYAELRGAAIAREALATPCGHCACVAVGWECCKCSYRP